MDTSAFEDADWERLNDDLNAEIFEFCQGNSDPEELHAFAGTWNCDGGVWALKEILHNPACEAATALLIYWKCCPEFYIQYEDRRAVELADDDVELFDFLSEIEARHIAGEFRAGAITFDPSNPASNPSGLCMTGLYDHMKGKFVRALPSKMYAAIP